MRPFYADVFDKWCWWCRIVTWLNFSDLSWARSRMKWGDKHFDFNPKNATKNIGLTNSSCLNGWLWSDHINKLPTHTDYGLLASRLSHMTWVRIQSSIILSFIVFFQIILSIKSSEIYKIRPLTETCTVTSYVNCKSRHLAFTGKTGSNSRRKAKSSFKRLNGTMPQGCLEKNTSFGTQ